MMQLLEIGILTMQINLK